MQPSAAPVVHNTNGVQNQRAAAALVGLTGNWDVPGGNVVTPAVSTIQLTGQSVGAGASMSVSWSDAWA